MEIKQLNKRSTIDANSKLSKGCLQLESLMEELGKRDLSEEVIRTINASIEQLNTMGDSDKKLGNQIRKVQSKIILLVEKEHKIVTKNYYRNTWMPIGVGMGISFGVVFGASMDNMALLALGIPIGVVLGMAIGTSMDNKAKEAGRQLDLEIKY